LLFAKKGEIMDWTKRINELVGQDRFIIKYSPNCEPFIDYLYDDNTTEDEEIASMPEQDTRLFKGYRVPLYKIASWVEPARVIELGTREGRSADSFVRAVHNWIKINNREDSMVHSFDPNPIEGVTVKYPKLWNFYPMTGEEGYEKYGNEITAVDLLYIDVDPHYFEPTNSLLQGYWRNNVRSGGCIVLDDAAPQFDSSVAGIDYGGVWRPVRDYGVLRAILSFVDENDSVIDYCFTVFNNHCNGFSVIKFKE
jgi:hypothetical protein